MNLRSDYPYWLLKNGLMHHYPSLQKDIRSDVVIIGGGISGALMAYHLQQAGIEACVVDKRSIGMGSTAATTALLQYEIDIPLHKLMLKTGRKQAEVSYLLCLEAIHTLAKIARETAPQAGFEYRKSLFYASVKKDQPILEKEYVARKKIGIDLEMIDSETFQTMMPFSAPAALLSDVAAQVDAYRLTHGIFQHCIRNGMPVYDNTGIVTIDNAGRSVRLITANGCRLFCKKIIFATGYESVKYIDKPIARLHSTYANISEPMEEKVLWYKNCLIWESAHPYLYLRVTPENRIIIGGKDEVFYSPVKRDRLIQRKSIQLANSFHTLFPHLSFHTDYTWCGTFAETKDGLPYIGRYRDFANAYFALGYGGNGITFSVIAAQLIADELNGVKNKHAAIFRFER